MNLRIREVDKSNYSCVINFGLKHKLYMKFNFDILDKKDNIRKLEIKSFHEDQSLDQTSFSTGQYRLPKFSMLIGTNDRKIDEVSQHDFKIAWGTGLYDFNILCKCVNHGIYLCKTRPLLEMFVKISNNSLSSIFSDLDYSYDENGSEVEYYDEDEDVEEFDPEYNFLHNSKWENFKFKSMKDIGSNSSFIKTENKENSSIFYNYLKHNGGENMSRVYTIKTRLDMDGVLGDYLKDYITFYSRLSRVIFRDIITGVVKEFHSVSKYVTVICMKFRVTKRTVNSIRYDMNGKIRAYKELKKTELKQLEIKIEGLESEVSKGKEELRKLFPLVAENRASSKQLERYRQGKTSLYYATMKLERTRHKREQLNKAMKCGKVSICFGSKRLFHSQFHLKEHGYKTHEKWLHDFRKARDSNLYYLGCGSESYGNQMLQLQPSKDGSYTLHIRKENSYCETSRPQDKWITVSGIRFSYLSDWLRSCVDNHKPITCRIVRRGRKWYLCVIFSMEIPKRTTSKYRVFGCDYNHGFLEVAQTDRYGNLTGLQHISLNYHRTGNKAKSELEERLSKLVRSCSRKGKDLIIEDLDFRKKKSGVTKGKNRRYNQRIHTFDYARYQSLCVNLCEKYGVVFNTVNPAYTSQIGEKKYCDSKKLTGHQAAAYVIARRGQGFEDRLEAV